MSHLFYSEPAYRRAPAAPDPAQVTALWSRYCNGETYLATSLIQLHLRTAAAVARHWSNRRTFPDALGDALLALTKAVQDAQKKGTSVDNPTGYLAQAMRHGVLKSRQRAIKVEGEDTISLDQCNLERADFAGPPEDSSFEAFDYLDSFTRHGRDRAILRLKAQGLTNLEIAGRIGISEEGVRRSIRGTEGRLACAEDPRR